MPKLTIQIPDQEEAAYEFDDPVVTVGRNEGNDIVIAHDSMSGTHAEFTLNEDGTYNLSDKGSTNGTFVDGEQINSTILPQEAEVVFGHVTAHFSQPELESQDEEEADEAAEELAASAASMAAAPSGPIGRPANFTSISPLPRNAKKKDPAGQAVVALGILALVCAGALTGAVFLYL